MKTTVWTPERVETLKALWTERKSAAEIARQIGCGLTRNAVLGKVYRLDLPTRAEPRKPYRTFARTWMPEEKRKQKHETTPAPEIPPSLDIAFLDLKASHCRYPVNDALPYLFCGQTRQADSSYCAHHHALTHTEPLDLSADERDRRAARARQAAPLLSLQKLEEDALRILPRLPGEAA